MVSAEQAAKNWLAGYQSSRGKAEAAINAVTVAPGQKAAANADKWHAKVSSPEAQQKFTQNVASVSLADWKRLMVGKGLTNGQNGAIAGQSRVAKYFAAAKPIIEQIKAEADAMDTSTLAAALQKANFVATAMKERLSGLRG